MFADELAAAIQLLLEPPGRIGDELLHLVLLDRVEQLAVDASRTVRLFGVLVGHAVFAGLEGSRPVLVEIQALLAPNQGGSPRRSP